MRNTLCAILAGVALATVGCGKQETPKEETKEESVTDYVAKAYIMPFAMGSRQLHFISGPEGSEGGCVLAKQVAGQPITTYGCLYTEGNRECCGQEPNPTLISDFDYNALRNHLLNDALKEYFMRKVDGQIFAPKAN